VEMDYLSNKCKLKKYNQANFSAFYLLYILNFKKDLRM